MVRPDLQDILKQFRGALEEIYGDRLVKVILYGSQARGDARPDSDVDVLVVLRERTTDAEAERVAWVETELCIEHGIVITTMPVLESEYGKREPLLVNIRLEGVPI